jgi:hypothetical protein
MSAHAWRTKSGRAATWAVSASSQERRTTSIHAPSRRRVTSARYHSVAHRSVRGTSRRPTSRTSFARTDVTDPPDRSARHRFCSGHWVPVSFDVDYRAALWRPDDAAVALRELAGWADLVFASADEARMLGLDGDPRTWPAALPNSVVGTVSSSSASAARSPAPTRLSARSMPCRSMQLTRSEPGTPSPPVTWLTAPSRTGRRCTCDAAPCFADCGAPPPEAAHRLQAPARFSGEAAGCFDSPGLLIWRSG